jgi:hypothetical protein
MVFCAGAGFCVFCVEYSAFRLQINIFEGGILCVRS